MWNKRKNKEDYCGTPMQKGQAATTTNKTTNKVSCRGGILPSSIEDKKQTNRLC